MNTLQLAEQLPFYNVCYLCLIVLVRTETPSDFYGSDKSSKCKSFYGWKCNCSNLYCKACRVFANEFGCLPPYVNTPHLKELMEVLNGVF